MSTWAVWKERVLVLCRVGSTFDRKLWYLNGNSGFHCAISDLGPYFDHFSIAHPCTIDEDKLAV